MPPFTPKSPPLSLLRRLTSGAAASRPLSTAAAGPSPEARPQKLVRIADELLALSKAEREDYAVLFRLKLGLDKFVPAGGVPAAGGGQAASEEAKPAEEKVKTAFDIKLEKFDAAAKIKVIKEVRTFTDLGLKEAKELVEKVPVVLKKGVTKEEAEAIAAKLKEVGATVVLE